MSLRVGGTVIEDDGTIRAEKLKAVDIKNGITLSCNCKHCKGDK